MSVYFISARELDLVKIGYAFDPVRRYQHLRTFSPIELTLEGAIPGGFEKERELHQRFALARARGEWFKLTPSLQREIDASTRPEKFTWAAVRIWREGLIAQTPPDEPKRWITKRPEMPEEREERIQNEEIAKLKNAGDRQLRKLELRGEISFPFRERLQA